MFVLEKRVNRNGEFFGKRIYLRLKVNICTKPSGSNTTTLGRCSAAVCNPTISTSTNRISQSGYSFDANGNLTVDGAGNQFSYDAENHQKEVKDSGNNSLGTYQYDGDGRRVKKVAGSETTIFVYNAGGQLVAEYSTVTPTTPQVSYLTQDHLGSPRVITNEVGSVTSRKDFAAFGDEVASAQRVSGSSGNGYTADEVRKDYTGYEKDTESGLQFAQARYYNTTHGRYTSIDPLTASASIKNPQTFNRYSYVLNSPYKFVDPLGLLSVSTGACGTGCPNSGPWVDGSAFRGRDSSFDWTKQTAAPPRKITISGGTKEQREAIQNSIETLKSQSATAKFGFAVFEGNGDGYELSIEILSDKDFEQKLKDNGVGETNALAVTTNMGGGNYLDPNAGENAAIFIKESAIDVKKETADRKSNRETTLDAILGHELGHAYGISRNYVAYHARSKEDKSNKVGYHDRQNEQAADYVLKWISLERSISSGVKDIKQNLRFPKTVIRNQ